MRGVMSRRRVLGHLGVAGIALTTGAVLAGPAGASSTDVLVVNTDGSRLRSGAGTGFGVVASLAKGTEVRYLASGGNANGYIWYQVRVLATGREGYIASSLVAAPGTGSGDPGFPPNVVVASGPLRVRRAPGLSQQVLASVAVGAKGWLTQRTSTIVDGHQWFKVTFLVNSSYVTGYVAAGFIRIS